MSQTPALTKTCSSCGENKPLAAFLHLGANGTEYGNICSTCRKTQANATPNQEQDESTRSTTRKTIDSKSKVASDKSKWEEWHQTEEQYHEERDATEELTNREEEKIQLTQKDERKHREVIKNRSFLETNKRRYQDTGDSRAQNEQRTAQQATNTRDNQEKDQFRKEEATREDMKQTQVDFGGSFQDTHIAKEKYVRSSVFNSYKQWLGNSGIVKNAEKAGALKTKQTATLTEVAKEVFPSDPSSRRKR
jgi:hypothetical protein